MSDTSKRRVPLPDSKQKRIARLANAILVLNNEPPAHHVPRSDTRSLANRRRATSKPPTEVQHSTE